nr:PREDICTED: DNA fragmentation factor subunit beta [Bemisia tabaci]
MKGYKVTDAKWTKIVGIAANSLSELVLKGCKKLNITFCEGIKAVLHDGTEVDSESYFKTLPSQSLLIIQEPGKDVLTGANLIYNALTLLNLECLKAGELVNQFFTENIKEKVRELAKVLDEEDGDKTLVSKKVEDPEWFAGLDTNSTTKEDFMFRRCQDRIRGYLYKSKSDITKSKTYNQDFVAKTNLLKSFQYFSSQLQKDKHFGFYFDRSSTKAMCNNKGDFYCMGPWNEEKCLHGEKGHIINPYQSREARIVFSTWNLDHWIERSRSVLPALLNASELVKDGNYEINNEYFYSLLFTSKNLKLVHIVCHDKGEHKTAKCDPLLTICKLDKKSKSKS